MNYKDLQELLEKIEVDSMCRDEIFYDTQYGYEGRRVEFFKNLKELQVFFRHYLYHEKELMKGIEFDEHKHVIIKEPKELQDGEEQFMGLINGKNNRKLKI